MRRFLVAVMVGASVFATPVYAETSLSDANQEDECNSEFVAPADYVYQFSGADCNDDTRDSVSGSEDNTPSEDSGGEGCEDTK